MPTIGTLNENPLHAALKERYARPDDGVVEDQDEQEAGEQASGTGFAPRRYAVTAIYA